MPRINIEDSLWSDDRFIELIEAIGRVNAIGSWVLACKSAQKFWMKDKAMIPKDRAMKLPHFDALCEVGILVKKEAGFYFVGSENQFAWIVQKQIAGKKGGSSKINRLEPSGGEAASSGSKRRQASSSSSSSYSYSVSKKDLDKSKSSSTSLKKSAKVAAAEKLPKHYNANSLDEVLFRIASKKMDSWLNLYDHDQNFIKRELEKAWGYYAEDYPAKKPKSDSGWMRAFSSWLERGWADRARKTKTFKSKQQLSQENTQKLVDWVQEAADEETGGENEQNPF